MQKTPPSESGFSRLRLLAALVLCTVGIGLAAVGFAANPSSGTVTTTTTTPVTWQGTAPGGAGTCTEGLTCDSFKLTVAGTPQDWATANKKLRIKIQWLLNSSDYDLEVRKGTINGPVVASSGGFAGTSEEVVIEPGSASIGTGDFFVRTVYFAATAADQYNGVVTVVQAAGSSPAPQASGVAPRYQNFTAPAAGPLTLGKAAAEPSIGVNWMSETGTNGGRSMYIALTQTLRVTFNDACPSSPSSLWEDKTFPTTGAITFDPILYTDNARHNPRPRTIVSQLVLGTGSFSTDSAYTDNDGDTWLQSQGAGIGQGIDHQTIGGGGPFHAPVPVGAIYPNAVYYCAQLPGSACALSLDGGQTFGPATQTALPTECGGLHGHIKVGPDGTAYLPNKGCGTEQAAIVSENNGLTWQIRRVPGSTQGGSDPAVSIGRGDQLPGRGRVYLGYADGNQRAVITTSDDRGLTWSPPLDVGAAFGINNVAFPAVVAGDDNRAAFAFLGTSVAGPLQGERFRGVWHLYVAHTYDGGQTWHTVDATPTDPMQRGCIWLGGGANICRNMLDFMGIDVDKRGRVLVAYNDGCAGAECSQAGPEAIGNSYTSIGVIARQAGGKGLFAAQDALVSDAQTAPGVPYVTALRNNGVVKLAWSTSNDGGSPVTQYTISRGTSSGSQTFLANVPGSQTRYVDATATDPNATYFYRVAATNAIGSSCGNNEVSARFVGNSSVGEGYGLLFDPNEVGAPTANPDLDIERLSIAEPSSGPHAGKLVINLKVRNLSLIPNERMWRIIWDSPNAPAGKFYAGMTKDAAGAVSFEYGTVFVDDTAIAVGIPTTSPVGPPDAGSFTPAGLITIVISKDKIGDVRTGDLLGNFEVRTYNVDSEVIRTNNAIDQATGTGGDKTATANDLTANAATYLVVGTIPGVNSIVSRKTHGSAGTFDVNLPLIAGATGVESRNDGTNTHQVVFRFADPVTFSSATVTPAAGGTASVAGVTTSGNDVIVNLANVSDVQTITVTLINVVLNGTATNVAIPMGILHGDADGNRSVTATDISIAKAISGQATTGGTFRADVTPNGTINSSDIGLIKSKSGNSLPPPVPRAPDAKE